jgi:hypothetical protein
MGLGDSVLGSAAPAKRLYLITQFRRTVAFLRMEQHELQLLLLHIHGRVDQITNCLDGESREARDPCRNLLALRGFAARMQFANTTV